MHKCDENEVLLVNLLDDANFKDLSATEERFNIFDALGVRRQELRHSDFLSYLLDPSRPHGLGDSFLRDFLLNAISDAEIDLPDVFHGVPLRLESLNDVRVTRERHNIDILLEMEDRWLVAIENKIGAKEHGNQLQRYESRLKLMFPNLPILFLYLTPMGVQASEDNWLSLSYGVVNDLVYKWSQSSNISEEVKVALVDYVEFLEGHVLEDSKTAELCRKIYQRHKQAIDLLIEHVPTAKDFYLDLAQQAIQQLADEGKVVLDDRYRKVSRFYDIRLKDDLPEVLNGEWTSSNKGILFEWEIDSEFLRVDLVIGPLEAVQRQSIVSHLETGNYKRMLREIPKLKIATKISKRYAHYTKTPVIPFGRIDEDIELDSTEDLVRALKAQVEEIMNKHFAVLSEVFSGS